MEVQLGDMQLSDLIKTSGQTQSKSQSLSGSDQTGSSAATGRASGESDTQSSSYNYSNASPRDFEQTLNKRIDSRSCCSASSKFPDRRATSLSERRVSPIAAAS